MTTNIISEGADPCNVKTETSPLKANYERTYFSFKNLLCDWEDDHSGSLKSIVIVLFGTTGAITLALLTQIYYGEYQIQPHGSVTSDSYECSYIGADILKKGGNAIDAAVAAAVCLGVINFHVTGLGGGGYLMLYNHRKRKVLDAIDFREVVPESYSFSDVNQHQVDGPAVGVPGFLMGLWEAHQKYGKLQWKDLIMPASNLAKYGFKVSKGVVSAAAFLKATKYNSNLVRLMKPLREGQNITFPELGTTLETIACKGVEAFYNGTIAMDIVYSVKLANGNISLDDVFRYSTFRSNILRARMRDFDVIVPDSSGGALLLNFLDALEILDLNEQEDTPPEIILKMSDMLHDTYLSFLQKINVFSEQSDSTGSQVSVVDGGENYVTIVSGLNTWLGSQILTNAGFILNNALSRGIMNVVKRPVSFVSPIIVIQNNEVCGRRFVLGSGDVIMAAQLLTNLLIFNKNTSDSIENPRFNIDNIPRHLRLEEFHIPQFSSTVTEPLKQLVSIENIFPPYKSMNVIEISDDSVYAYADSRGGGAPVQI